MAPSTGHRGSRIPPRSICTYIYLWHLQAGLVRGHFAEHPREGYVARRDLEFLRPCRERGQGRSARVSGRPTRVLNTPSPVSDAPAMPVYNWSRPAMPVYNRSRPTTFVYGRSRPTMSAYNRSRPTMQVGGGRDGFRADGISNFCVPAERERGRSARCGWGLHGYLAHKKQPTPLGPP